MADSVPTSTMVMDMTTKSGEWDWGRLSVLLPPDILDRILVVSPPQPSFGLDSLVQSTDDSHVGQWSCRFVVFCWLLWKGRCTRFFEPDSIEHEDILTRGNRLAALGWTTSRSGMMLEPLITLVEEESKCDLVELDMATCFQDANTACFNLLNDPGG
ncbi:hypothetical protein V6N11_082887 [Hibiscus sabdariffa]|uniref:Uncharacterized protein n=1 Tax=Hibiscus sabdariffa TaxID=183260 RepID=A0ABR2QK88_9ROSI